MDPSSPGPLVVEGGLAEEAGPPPAGAAVVVARERAGCRLGPTLWRPLAAEQVLAVLLAAPADALVLARPAAADPGAGCLPALARLLDLAVIALPSAAGAAAWTVALAWRWRAQGEPSLERLLQVLAGLDGHAGGLPRRPWGASGTPVPALRPAVLARWAAWAWRPCGWCRGGGGLPARPCGRCGAPVPAAAPARRPALRPAGVLAAALS